MSERRYIRFHSLDPDKVVQIDDSDLSPEPRLFLIGRLELVGYSVCSPSEKDQDTVYIHKFAEDGGELPYLLAGESGRTLYIYRGSFRVDDWIRG